MPVSLYALTCAYCSRVNMAALATNVGLLHLDGIGGARNVTRASWLLEYAAQRNHSEAVYTMGW